MKNLGVTSNLNKNVYINNLTKSNTDNNLKRIEQKAYNNAALLATKAQYKKILEKNYKNLNQNTRSKILKSINNAPSLNYLFNTVGPAINKAAKRK